MSERDADAGSTGELLALVDRLGLLLDENDLAELEVDADGTRVLLRRHREPQQAMVVGPAMDAGPVPSAPPVPLDSAGAHAAAAAEGIEAAEPGPTLVAVISPLTGIFYASPAPGSAPYVTVGGEVAVGQVIGLVEAMKLFNEIKSQVAGRVVRVAAETGALIKAKQALIEVEPL